MTDRECPRVSAFSPEIADAPLAGHRAGRQRVLWQFDDSVPAFQPTVETIAFREMSDLLAISDDR